jgi:protein associated with RNAse G/E
MNALTEIIIQMIENEKIKGYKHNGNIYKSLDELINDNFPIEYFDRKYFYALTLKMIEEDQIEIIFNEEEVE